MLIRVMYKDGNQDRVKAAQLQALIQSCQIKMFKRFSGWVSVVCDETRGKRPHETESHDGDERRKDGKTNNVFLDEPSDM